MDYVENSRVPSMTVLVPVRGDQLSLGLSSLAAVSKQDAIVLMMEVA